MKSIFEKGSWYVIPEPDDPLHPDNLGPETVKRYREILGHSVAACLGLENVDVTIHDDFDVDPEVVLPDEAVEIVVSCNGVALQLPYRGQEAAPIPLQATGDAASSTIAA